MPHHKSVRLGRKIKAVRFILPLLALLAVIGLAIGHAYDPTPAEASHRVPTPQNVHVTSAALHSITITWNPVTASDVTGYHVQHKVSSSNSWSSNINVPLGTTSYTFTSLAQNETYDLRVRAATDSPHLNSWYAEIDDQNTANLGPQQPRKPSVSTSIQTPAVWPNTQPVWQATLNWEAPWDNTVRGADKYQVKLGDSLDDTGPWTDVPGGANARSYTFRDLPLGFNRIAFVRACATTTPDDLCGHHHVADVAITTMSSPGPVVGPIVVTASRELYGHRYVPQYRVVHQFSYSVVGVQFNDRFHQAQGFDLDWSESATGQLWHGLIRGGGLSSFVSAWIPERLPSVYVRVRGVNQGGAGPWSDPVQVSFTPYIDSVSAEANLTTATLRWSVVGGSEIHKFEVSEDNGRTWDDADVTVDFVPDPVRILSHTFTGLTKFTDYTLRVRPCDADDNCAYGPAAFVTTNGPDAAPGPLTDLSMGINTCYKEFRWRITPPEITETAGKAKYYEFQWRLDSDSDNETAWRGLRSKNVPKFRNTWGFWTVPAAFGERGKFHMRVRAVNDHGHGPWINTGDANRDKVCSAQADLAPVTGESYTDPTDTSGTQPGDQTAMNQAAGVTVTAADPVALAEGGSAATYTVVLDGQPIGNVTITMSSDNGDVTMQPSSLTFTTGNWHTPRTVTVRAGHDDDAADDTATVSHTVSGAQGYAGITVASVSVSVTDDDTAGVTVSESSLDVPEGSTATYTVVLDTRPVGDVIIFLASSNGVTVEPLQLTFTSSNWQSAQTVTVRADQDDDTEDETTAIYHGIAAFAGSAYVDVTVASVAVSITDDDQLTPLQAQQDPEPAADPGSVTLSAANLPVREGDDATYTVVLDVEPTANVVITVNSNNGEVTTQPASLTFTTGNWQSAQTVTVRAGQDSDESNDSATLSHAASGGNYDGVSVASVTVSVTDDDGDRAVLETFYNATGGGSWTNNSNWLSAKPLNQWHGVSANSQGQVTHLSLRNNNLSGSLPAKLGQLDSLQVLSLDRNSIGGSLPSSLGNLSNLTRLAMNRNNLSGSIPSQLGSLSNLSIIGLARNNLSGGLPTSLGNLSGLTRLSLHDNTALNGALPSGFTGLTNLQRLAIANTNLCAPNDEGFSDWLDTVSDKPGGVQTCE